MFTRSIFGIQPAIEARRDVAFGGVDPVDQLHHPQRAERVTGIFARLETPVDFEALDDQPVDLVFLLLAPEGAGADHLKALSRIARALRDQDLVARLRSSDTVPAIEACLNQEQASAA